MGIRADALETKHTQTFFKSPEAGTVPPWDYYFYICTNQRMMQMERKFLYSVPDCEELSLHGTSVLCASPGNGESEDITYEDWDSLIS